MKNLLIAFLVLSVARAVSQDKILLSHKGIAPDTGKDVTKLLQAVLNSCRDKKTTLVFEKGTYDLYPESGVKAQYYISNSASKSDSPEQLKTIGMYLKNIDNLTIEGNGALIMLHGEITSLLADHCKNLTIKNLAFDYERPTMSEFTIVKADSNYAEVNVNPSSWYRVKNGVLYWYGENWDGEKEALNLHTVFYSPTDSAMHYSSEGWGQFIRHGGVTELAKNRIRFKHPKNLKLTPGEVYTMRDIKRDQVGAHLTHCENVLFQGVKMHFMHGLGIVAQLSKNIHYKEITCAPRPETGRICASTADFMHFSLCSGKIKVENSFFSGAHDDPINVHGVHFRVVKTTGTHRITVRFMHPQTYGFLAFEKGDKIEFVNHRTLVSYALNQVTEAKMKDEYETELTLKNPIPSVAANDCIENVTRTPEAEIRNNQFQRTHTRGILITTRRKSVIENNVFYKTGMSAVLASDDANNWYESGAVKNLLIQNNRFIECGYGDNPNFGAITIFPETEKCEAVKYVHQKVVIKNNFFKPVKVPVVTVSCTKYVEVSHNKMEVTKAMQGKIEGIEVPVSSLNVGTLNMN